MLFSLKSIEENRSEYEKLITTFEKYNIGYFFYNGGGDSQDTAYKVSQLSQSMNYPITCIGIPKTVDNDLPITDNCPGFGSVAKYIAISTQEAGLDVASMAATSTKVFILEVMGRHAGWIAAAAGIGKKTPCDPPHIILFPEIPFDQKAFLAEVDRCVKEYGYCVVAVSEGTRYPDGKFLADAGTKDAFGHAQLGGVAVVIAEMVKSNLGHKYHWAVADYLQRSARHIASKTDVDQAYALGKAAIEAALAGKNNIMMTIERKNDDPYEWAIGECALCEVAGVEKFLPRKYITENGFGITRACQLYLKPLINGEDYPPYNDGLPQYIRLKNMLMIQ